MIPKQLRDKRFRFVKILTKEKAPFEKDWTATANYTHEEIQKWIDTGANYGVLCGGDLIVVDTDTPESEAALKDRLQPTFTVQTAKGFHRYYFCKGVSSMKLRGGDLQSNGKQVVGVGSIHPSEIVYKVTKDVPIKKITKKQLFEELTPVMPYKPVSEGEDINELLKPCEKGGRNDAAFKIAVFFRRAGKSAEGVLKGLQGWNQQNPLPLSDQELQRIVASVFRGEEYKTFFKQNPSDYFKEESKKAPEFEMDTIDYTDLIKKDIPHQLWLVDNLIPATGVTVLGGKRSSFKSWIAMDLALAAATGGHFLGRTPVKKTNVLYINSENDDLILVPRLRMLGYKTKGQEMNGRLHFLNFSPFTFTQESCVEQLEAFILNQQVGLIICDPFSGTFDGDENDAVTVRGIFTKAIGQISNKYDVAFVLIHHMRKGQGGGKNHSTDKMDELRGSSEFANYVSSIIISERPRKGTELFVLHHVKNRAGEESATTQYEVVSDEENLTFEFKGYGDETGVEVNECLNAILIWAADGTEFKTKEAHIEFKDKFSRRNVGRALKAGVDDGSLNKPSYGFYVVTPQGLEKGLQKTL